MDELNEKLQKLYGDVVEADKEKLQEAKLTRAAFVELANLMKNAKTLDGLKEDILMWLKSTNPMFDENRFRQAAGM